MTTWARSMLRMAWRTLIDSTASSALVTRPFFRIPAVSMKT
jgi:hypothetical protein